MLIVNLGYALRANDQRIGADCGNGPPEGMAVPRVGGRLDPSGLSACLQRWLPSESVRRITIVANPGTPLSDVLATAESVLTAGATFRLQVST